MTRRATLEDVASRAGVSRQTVSNVINSPDIVREQTRERVRAAIDDLGYRPNAAARQLVTRRSRVLGFAMPPARPGTRYAVGGAFLHALTEAAQDEGYRIMLFSAGTDGDEIAQYADLLDGADLDGFVLANTHHGDPRTRWLTDRAVPFVTFGRPWGDPGASHHWVDVDGAAGTRAAVEHLAGAGHRAIAFIGWPVGSGVGDDRRAGWLAGMTTLGSPAEILTSWHTSVEDSVEAAVGPITELLLTRRPTALVCVSDTVAIAALQVRRDLDLPVAVVGFDDAPVAEPLGLSSLRQPLAQAAARCLELVVGNDRAATVPDHVLLAPDLITRSSSRTTVVLPATPRRNP